MKIQKLVMCICCLTITLTTYCQSTKTLFCGKEGMDNRTPIVCTIKELSECNWKITTSDQHYIVKSFKISILSLDNTFQHSEIQVEGNEIPKAYREKIKENAKTFLLEYIQALLPDGSIRSILPLSVTIERQQ